MLLILSSSVFSPCLSDSRRFIFCLFSWAKNSSQGSYFYCNSQQPCGAFQWLSQCYLYTKGLSSAPATWMALVLENRLFLFSLRFLFFFFGSFICVRKSTYRFYTSRFISDRFGYVSFICVSFSQRIVFIRSFLLRTFYFFYTNRRTNGSCSTYVSYNYERFIYVFRLTTSV